VTNRDDFTEKTKEIMAKKVRYLCSKPDCRKSTIGSKADSSNFMRVGTAAHITAAAEGGPRYDPDLTPAQRKHESNGIWLCPGCGRLVDADDAHFTVKTMRAWKIDAEKQAFESIAYALSDKLETPVFPTVTDLAFARRLGLPATDDVESCTLNLIKAAKNDICAFKNAISWPKHPVLLGLKLVNGNEIRSFSAANLAESNNNFNEITVIAPPGTGKTTTLIQFTECILESNANVAVYISLSEWAVQSTGFFQSLSGRSAFAGFKAEHFTLMAHSGRLSLILDGWNELNEGAKLRVSYEIKALRRDYPSIRINLSTRQNDLDITLTGPIVKIDALSEDQQKEMAVSLRGNEGERLLDHAWRTPGIKDLISIPLYLTVLLSQTSGEALPTTKEEILRLFVDNHEQDIEKATELRKIFLGIHRDILYKLAAEATYEITTAISESRARSLCKSATDSLIEQGQLASPIEPATALNAFVNLHTLIRSDTDGALSFQHQQFQEWYASFHVEGLMLSAKGGNSEDLDKLREYVIDQRIWEESILFACERLSRADASEVEAVAFTIQQTLGIDPLLSAEIIYRSSEDVWHLVKDDVQGFVQKWHRPGQVDRAVSFMINTGRPDFFEYLWPLFSDENDQVHLAALRAGKRFRAAILGAKIQIKLSSLPEKLRKHIISEIAHYGDIPGMELSTQLAIDDPSAKVKFETIGSLLFRHADRQASEILRTSPDEVWSELAKHNYADVISDPECQERLRAELKKYIGAETDPYRKVRTLISRDEKSDEIASQIETLLSESDPPTSTEHHYCWTLEHEYKAYPNAVINALVKRLETDKEMPYMAYDYLRSSDIVIEKGLIVDRLIANEVVEHPLANTRICLAVAGPATIGKLLDRLVETNKRIITDRENGTRDEKLNKQYYGLRRYLSLTNDKPFIKAILERPQAKDAHEIALLSELLARHGDSHDRDRFNVPDDDTTKIVELVEVLGKFIISVEGATRYHIAEVASAIGRIASPLLTPLLQQLLDEDLARHKQQKEDFLEALEKGRCLDNGANTYFYRSYTEALVKIGDEAAIEVLKSYLPNQYCGEDAAIALKEIWEKKQPSTQGWKFKPSPDFTEAREKRNAFIKGQYQDSAPFVEDILSVVTGIIESSPNEKERQHALKLAKIAFTMPYGNKSDLINRLIQLPGPASEKNGILTVLATAGEELNGELLLQGIQELFEEAEQPNKQWMLQDQNGYHIRIWLTLLPFSDRPEAVIDVFKRLWEKSPHISNPWNMKYLSTALGYSSHPEALNVLKQLAEVEPGFIIEHEWIHALIKMKTLDAARAFFELTQAPQFSTKASQMNIVDMGRDLSYLISEFPELRREVYNAYKGLKRTPIKELIERAIMEKPDAEGILILINECAADGRSPRNTPLYSALRRHIIGERASQHWIGANELYSVPAHELRKSIFEVFRTGNENEAQLAKECLVAFDDIRDEYGVAELEPRHPDIKTRVPWPCVE
jgi:hypothetical protein